MDGTLERITAGAVAGLAATFLLQQLRQASQARLPWTLPPMRGEPGAFVVERAESALPASAREEIPEAAEAAAAGALGMGYGAAFGAFYGALRPAAEDAAPEAVLGGGALLGLAS